MSEQQPQEELTLHDVMMLVNIIDLAKRREKFSEEEVSNIGDVFDRLVSFVEAKKEEIATADSESA